VNEAFPVRDEDAWAHWESTRRELLAIADRIALPPADRSELFTALDRSHAALAAWLVSACRPTEDSQLQR
jgi:hypothetical protein